MDSEIFETIEVSDEAFEEARYSQMGWCPYCEEFTTPGVAMRDSGRTCALCLDNGVCGTDHAISADFIRVMS